MRAAGLAASLLILAAGASAADVRVHVADRSPAKRCSAPGGVIVATSDDQSAVRAPIDAGHAADLTLPGEDGWRITAVAEDCWSTSGEWTPALGNAIALDLYAAAEVSGSFTAAPRERASAIAGSMQLATGERSDIELLDCSLDFPAWRCAVPADVPLDVRIDPQGFAPVHYWNIVARAGETQELEPQVLIAGASLNGRVHDAEGRPVAGAAVSLAPLEPSRPALRRAEAKSNAKGFFQFAGMTPGEYRLVARAEGRSPAVVPVVTMRPNQVLTLPRRLALLPLVSLDVALDPARSPDGKRWTVAMYERVPLSAGSTDPAVRRPASEDGRWTAKNLRADAYRLVVEDSSGSVFEERTIDLSDGSGAMLPISIHALPMRGRILVGDDPLRAQIRFTNGGGKGIWVSSDSDGWFDAPFPSPGDWQPMVYPSGQSGPKIRATSIHLDAASRPPLLEIHLPGGRLKGTVVASSGNERKRPCT